MSTLTRSHDLTSGAGLTGGVAGGDRSNLLLFAALASSANGLVSACGGGSVCHVNNTLDTLTCTVAHQLSYAMLAAALVRIHFVPPTQTIYGLPFA